MTTAPIADRLAALRERLAAAALLSGRSPDAVTLCAVSKTFPPEAIATAIAAGQTVFGESRVQEALTKIPLFPNTLHWHFIGHLQSNKIRKILPLTHLFHTLDSLDLARHFSRIASELNLTARCLLQVNIARDDAKFGLDPDITDQTLTEILALPNLSVAGLMTIPALTESADAARPHFSHLRDLRDQLAASSGLPLPELSMGMSGDWEAAVAEGATIVRIGSAIFGDR